MCLLRCWRDTLEVDSKVDAIAAKVDAVVSKFVFHLLLPSFQECELPAGMA